MKNIENVNDVKNALVKSKFQLARIQEKIREIEKLSENEDSGIFEYYFPEIEFEINYIEGALENCENLSNVILKNINDGFVSDPLGDKYVPLNNAVSGTIKKCKIKFKEVECLIEQAQKGR